MQPKILRQRSPNEHPERNCCEYLVITCGKESRAFVHSENPRLGALDARLALLGDWDLQDVFAINKKAEQNTQQAAVVVLCGANFGSAVIQLSTTC